jgi:PAS domain-containing protein
MSHDVRLMLMEAAPRPSHKVDPSTVQRRGDRIRMVRYALATLLAVPLVAGVAWAGSGFDLPSTHNRANVGVAASPCKGVHGAVSIFLKKQTPASRLVTFRDGLLTLPHVNRVTYVSSPEAFAEFKLIYKDKPEFWANLSPRSLPASLRLDVDDISNLRLVTDAVPPSSIVADIRSGPTSLNASECRSFQVQRDRHFLERALRRAALRDERRAARRAAERAEHRSHGSGAREFSRQARRKVQRALLRIRNNVAPSPGT